jgi:hypothetical protein
VRATAVHPGGIVTELARHMPDGRYRGVLSANPRAAGRSRRSAVRVQVDSAGCGDIGLGGTGRVCG